MSEAGRRWLAPQLQESVAPGGAEPSSNLVTSLALARNLAAGIVSRAEGQARDALAEARAEGLRQGLEESRRLAEERERHFARAGQEQLSAELERLASLFNDGHARLWSEVRESLLGLVLTLTERLLGEQLELQPELLLTSIDEALAELAKAGEITLRLHPEDLEALRRRLPGEGLRLIGDPGLGRGDFVAEGSHGMVDGRLRTRLRRLEGSLNPEAAVTESSVVERG